MLRLTICLLVAKTAFAANAYPLDNGGFVPVGPDTNLVFNFQQIRRDQPSQVEMREENIHKYMNRPRTTTVLPVDNGDMSPMSPEHPVPYTAEQWSALQTAPKYDGPVASWKNVPAPPSFPHWDSLAVTNKYNGYESKPIVVTEESGQWYGPEMHSRSAPSYVPPVAPTTFEPTTFAPIREPTVRHSPRESRGRGHQRFNWNDVTTEVPTTIASVAPTAAPGRMPPPSVPTLSPWYDGF